MYSRVKDEDQRASVGRCALLALKKAEEASYDTQAGLTDWIKQGTARRSTAHVRHLNLILEN